MLNIHFSQRYFLYSGAVDMRKGFDALCGVVRDGFKMEPMSGDIFIFVCGRRNKIKLLQWQGDGFAIYYKRLEKGTFEVLQNACNSPQLISAQQVMLMMEGIKFSSVKKHVRYYRKFVDNSPMKNANTARA